MHRAVIYPKLVAQHARYVLKFSCLLQAPPVDFQAACKLLRILKWSLCDFRHTKGRRKKITWPTASHCISPTWYRQCLFFTRKVFYFTCAVPQSISHTAYVTHSICINLPLQTSLPQVPIKMFTSASDPNTLIYCHPCMPHFHKEFQKKFSIDNIFWSGYRKLSGEQEILV